MSCWRFQVFEASKMVSIVTHGLGRTWNKRLLPRHSMWTCIYGHFPSKLPKCIWIKPYIECLGYIYLYTNYSSLQLSLGTLKKDANSRKKERIRLENPKKTNGIFSQQRTPGNRNLKSFFEKDSTWLLDDLDVFVIYIRTFPKTNIYSHLTWWFPAPMLVSGKVYRPSSLAAQIIPLRGVNIPSLMVELAACWKVLVYSVCIVWGCQGPQNAKILVNTRMTGNMFRFRNLNLNLFFWLEGV